MTLTVQSNPQPRQIVGSDGNGEARIDGGGPKPRGAGEGSLSGIGTMPDANGMFSINLKVDASTTINLDDLPVEVREAVVKVLEQAKEITELGRYVADNPDDMSAIEKLQALLAEVRSDDILGELMIQFASMARENALDSELASIEAKQSQLEVAVTETIEAAAKMLESAKITAYVGLASAGVSAAGALGGGVQIGRAASSTKQMNQASNAATKLTRDASLAEAAGDTVKSASLSAKASALNVKAETLDKSIRGMMTSAEIINQSGGTVGKGAESIASIETAELENEARLDEADKLEAQALSEAAQALKEQAASVRAELLDLIKSVLEFLSTIKQSEADLMQTFTRV